MTQYTAAAPYYDRLMTGVDYDRWADYLCGIFDEIGKVRRVLDIGCGTGEMTLRMAERGYEVTGIDISSDMLALAENKARNAGADITFALQDMRMLRMANRVDAVICCLDGMNYLCGKNDLLRCMRSVRECLNDGGCFCFDMNTPYKFGNIYADRDYILEDEGVLCAWSNEYDRESGLCDFTLSFFAPDSDGRYMRTDEYQTERCYEEKEIKRELLRSGLVLKYMHGDLDRSAPEADTERWYFTAVK